MNSFKRDLSLLVLLLTLGFPGLACADDEPESKVIYLKNGQEMKCDKCWPGEEWQHSEGFKVWYQRGGAIGSISSSYVDTLRTFGDHFADKHRIALKGLQEQRQAEARAGTHC